MKRVLRIAVLIFALNQAISGQNYDFAPFDTLIRHWVTRKYYPGASICIVRNNTLIFRQSYGDYTPDKEVNVASAGKWVAAATVAVVVDKTKLGWDDTVEKWLPEFCGKPQGKIKLRNLVSHTSGIRDYLPSPEVDTFAVLKKSIERILTIDTVFAAGKRFQYGGLAMQIAGRMAEVAYGTNFEAIFQQEIAGPLGMTGSHFIPINTEGGHAPMLGGGLTTTLNDYMKFLTMIFHGGKYEDKQILQPATVAEMEHNQVGEALVSPGEYTEKALGRYRTDIYGLGLWREKVDSMGVAYQISSPGWAGAYPWINHADSVYGFFIAHVQGDAARSDGFSPFYDAPVISALTTRIVRTTQQTKTGYAGIGDALLYYEEKGQGEPLILLHAHSVDSRMWDAQFEELARHYRVIRYDLRGYGLSSMPVEGKDFTHAFDLEKFMDALKIEKAHLVGLSLGSLTITDFISRHPERVRSAVLAAGGMSFDLKPKEPASDLRAFKDKWKTSIRKGSCNDSPFLMSLIDEWRMWQVSHRESSAVFLGTEAREFFQHQKISIPVLFIVGQCDGAGAQKAALELATLIPGSQITYLQNAGHFSNIEQPEEFNEKLTGFIKNLHNSEEISK